VNGGKKFKKLTYGPRYVDDNVSWVIFGVPRSYGAENLSYGVPGVGVGVWCSRVGGIENKAAVLKKRVLTRWSGGRSRDAVPSSCGVVCVVLVIVVLVVVVVVSVPYTYT
jgi:hypothetical protein